MHIRLSREFSNLSELDLRAHDALIDRLLHVHLQRNHLLCLSPAEVVKLRRSIQFGPQAARTLDTILRRAQDYAASLRASPRHLVVLPLSSNERAPLGAECYVRSEELHWWLEHPPALYVENAISDGAVYTFLMSRAVGALGGSINNIYVRRYHGGGNPLGSVMEELVGEKIQGICICDRDVATIVPPFVRDSTSEKAHDALFRMRVVNREGVSEARNPFFNFHITEGWGVENYIGPHMLEVFFDNNQEACGQRGNFIDVFPNFPQLNNEEMEEWWTINLKSGRQLPFSVRQGLKERFSREEIINDRCDALSILSIPESVIPFIARFSRAGRFHRALVGALERDLENEIYKKAVYVLARQALISLAADSQMNFA
ncbi:hypothetical protein [Azospirillum agricola]|uniref:hypothetical protein n=1 Tax=Azospirillum agricola TaxID=1720247 RepID=UPI000A0EED8F|nr:hypothetical protein [Azospirillum agricola]SMH52374.1 hypothetical protein SAMN02982994_3115 [Azospirillum lipoferum]